MRKRFTLFLCVPVLDAEKRFQYLTYLKLGLSLLSLFQSQKYEVVEQEIDGDPNSIDTRIDVSW